tara:strand:+ start:871 stop:1071 length:201 start_codon:yes stop_codon:yes gene_type:complete
MFQIQIYKNMYSNYNMFFFQTRQQNERSKQIFERVKYIQKEIEVREKKTTQRKENLNYLFKTQIFV